MPVNIPPWHDEGELRELYVEKGLSSVDMAEEWGCSPSTVCEWLNEYGIERDGHGEVYWRVASDGYAYVVVKVDGKRVRIGEHRLAALVDNPPEEVFSSGFVTHHKSCLRSDNRPENLTTMGIGDHLRLHREGDVVEVDGWPVLK